VNPPGLFGSLRQLLATALELAQVRLELLATELAQEKLRVFDALLRGLLGGLLVGVGMVMVCVFVLVMFWEEHRVLVAGLLAAVFIGAGCLMLVAARRRLMSPSGVLSGSLAELGRDRAGLDESR
jgi:uncharacterized membrane protein YqjE